MTESIIAPYPTQRGVQCSRRAWPSEIYADVLEICTEYRDKGVVGMDISGDEATVVQKDGEWRVGLKVPLFER